MKKYSTSPLIGPILFLELHLEPVYSNLYQSFYRLLKILCALFYFTCITQCIEHTEQAIDDADEIYDKNLALVLDFFASKLHLYYSSSRLTLLLTLMSDSDPQYLQTDVITLSSRLKITDDDALGLYSTSDNCPDSYRKIFQDFLNSDHPLALDERRYAVAVLPCLKILFGHSQPPVLCITWFSQHSRALSARMEDHSQ